MDVLIVEDEQIAADRLKQLIQEVSPELNIVAHLDSVKSSIQWLTNNSPDLIFLDIQLADGQSFEIFESIQTDCPIIFTTAYDHFAIKAFKLNSLDYLLKPIVKDDLELAIQKFQRQVEKRLAGIVDMKRLVESLSHNNTEKRKERFVIKVGEHIKTVNVADIRVFYVWEKASYIHTLEGKKYMVDYTLDQVEHLIDPQLFFRINRKYIINLHQIKDIVSFSNSRLKIFLKNEEQAEDLIVARERVQEFKAWLDQ
ncbi:MAG: response regulator transcription factor [Cyclobacteriaceae bacterium]